MEEIVSALVDKPTLRRQSETLRMYFTAEMEFYNPYINSNMGLQALITIYQMAHVAVNYRCATVSPFQIHYITVNLKVGKPM